MGNVTLNGSTSGSITLAPTAVAGSNTITLPAGTGTVAVNGVSSSIVSGTSQASTSGTAISFTGIPAYVKRITVMFNGVSSSGSSVQLIRIGSGSFTTTGYLSTGGNVGNAGTPSISQFTTGFGVSGGTGSAAVRTGNFVLNNISGNTWVMSGVSVRTDTTDIQWAGGVLALSGTIDRIQITTVNGTDTFTAGSINILYE